VFIQNTNPDSILLNSVPLKSPELLKVKISFSVFYILSAHLEITRIVFKRIWRIRAKYFIINRDYDEYRVVCSTKNHLRICRKYFEVLGE